MSTSTRTEIALHGAGLAAQQQFDVSISIHAQVAIDAAAARRRASGWLVSQAGNLLAGERLTLVITDRAAWRVPVLFTSPRRGVIGQVGTVDVDAETGEVLADPRLVQELQEHASRLVGSAPAPAE